MLYGYFPYEKTWIYLDESKGGAKSFPKASEKIDQSQAYFSDFRK
jgi:hypothetical protein